MPTIPSFRATAAPRRPRDQKVDNSLGSGVIVGADGVIVTNNHVVEGGQEITVALNDRREFPARSCWPIPRTDLAVLKIDPPAETPADARHRRHARRSRWATWCWPSATPSASARR